MKYLSLDIEATGLNEDCLMIELGLVPFDVDKSTIETSLSFHTYVQCPLFENLKPQLDPWVIEHNKSLIELASKEGKTLEELRKNLINYLESENIKNYFGEEKIVLFGKSMNAIDLPFLNRDLGWTFMRKYFAHKILDLSSVAFTFIDLGILKTGLDSSSELMKFLNMGTVAHTALEDAVNTADMYLALLKMIKEKKILIN